MAKKNIQKIHIATDYTRRPGGRYIKDGDHSGEEFYKKVLQPQFKQIFQKADGTKLEINFDGTYGYASSFISEVFRRLVIEFKDKSKIKSLLTFVSNDDPFLENSIIRVLDETDETDTAE